jgi:hypothetical protein
MTRVVTRRPPPPEPAPWEADPALVQNNHPETSWAAAVTVNTQTQEEGVAHYLRECGARGATDIEIKEATGYTRARTRRRSLTERGWVIDSGRRRPTPSGKAAMVHVWVGDRPQPERTVPPPSKPITINDREADAYQRAHAPRTQSKAPPVSPERLARLEAFKAARRAH